MDHPRRCPVELKPARPTGQPRDGACRRCGLGGLALTVAATALMTATRVSPLWLLAAGGAIGGLGLL